MILATENISKTQTILSALPTLKIPKSFDFRSIYRIRIPKGDRLARLDLSELLSAVSTETLEKIKFHWEQRNIIDAEKKHKYPILTLDDKNLTDTLRWSLRGMSDDLAVWKVRIDLVNFLDRRDASIAETQRLSQVIQGFRVGNRVVLSARFQPNMTGWKGVIDTLREDYCLVRFDLDPKEISGGDKKWQVWYHCLSILRPEQPKLKQKKEVISKPKSLSKPILQAEKSKDEIPVASKEEAKIDIKVEQKKSKPPLPDQAEVKLESKVKYTMAQLVDNLKLSKPKSLPQSQDKPSYTAIELAEKLNISRAKIYQMRSSGTLEAAGYRVESSGRSLLFVPILQ
jgi:hypothetical protein